MSLTEQQQEELLASLLGPQKIRNDQGEIDFGDPAKRIAAIQDAQRNKAGLLRPGLRNALIGSLGSRLSPPGVDS